MAPRASGRVLVAGVGNVHLGDDAFGLEVVKVLAREPVPDGADVAAFGTCSLDLVYQLVSGGYDSLVLVDAVFRGGPPGTLYVLMPEELRCCTPFVDPHALRPHQLAGMVRHLGGRPCQMLVVGCEPARLCGEPGLSDAVARSLPDAARLVRALAFRTEEAGLATRR